MAKYNDIYKLIYRGGGTTPQKTLGSESLDEGDTSLNVDPDKPFYTEGDIDIGGYKDVKKKEIIGGHSNLDFNMDGKVDEADLAEARSRGVATPELDKEFGDLGFDIGKEHEWGAGSFKLEDFYDSNGNPLTPEEVLKNIEDRFPGLKNKQMLMAQIKDFAPKLEPIDPQEIGFLKQKYGGEDIPFSESSAGKKAGRDLKGDIYELQSTVGKAYDPTAAGRRQQIQTFKGVKAGQEKAYGEYGEEKDIAGADYAEGMFDLGKAKERDWETGLGKWLGSMEQKWFSPKKREGGYISKNGSGIGDNDETFLDILTKLPDAGGS